MKLCDYAAGRIDHVCVPDLAQQVDALECGMFLACPRHKGAVSIAFRPFDNRGWQMTYTGTINSHALVFLGRHNVSRCVLLYVPVLRGVAFIEGWERDKLVPRNHQLRPEIRQAFQTYLLAGELESGLDFLHGELEEVS